MKISLSRKKEKQNRKSVLQLTSTHFPGHSHLGFLVPLLSMTRETFLFKSAPSLVCNSEERLRFN